ncbi:MAG: glutamate ligase domain-containing protein [Halioglobus sp.]
MAAARHVGVTPDIAATGLARFEGVKRRLELRGSPGGVDVYDDFAHHPTAIATTLEGLRARAGQGRVLALIEPRSNTMRMGEHREQLAGSTAAADRVFWYQPADMDWSLDAVVEGSPVPASVESDIEGLVESVAAAAQAGDQVVIMSNGSFAGIHDKLLARLEQGAAA